ncbi:MAG: ATP-dependent 6-phosphofructokinase [Candidatus Firestonebacteria bacterium]
MRIGVLTGGGDCPGLNPAIRGIVFRAIDFNYEVVGIFEGWKGLIKNTSKTLTLEEVEEIISKGGTILGTSRTNPTKKEEDMQKVFENFKAMNLDALIAIGGEDTLGVANKLHQKGLPVVGVPKTMDNDLSCTDFTFGFDTSVTIAIDALERLRDTARSHRRVMVFEVMGRHAGWVALYTGIGGGADWILIPEKSVEVDKMCEHLKKAHARKKYAIVVVSEGVQLPSANAEKEELDAFGHMILKKRGIGEAIAEEIEKKTGIETRTAAIGHIQRGGSPTLFDRILGTRVGVKAVELIQEKNFGKMACLKGNEVIAAPLSEAVSTLKTVDESWVNFANKLIK